MSVLLVENELLQKLINFFITQLPENAIADSNPLKYAKSDMDFLKYIKTEFNETDETYTYSLVMLMNDIMYKGTIKFKHDFGSCEECDSVLYANSGSYQDDDNIVLPRDYMINAIKTLKFNSLSVND